MIQILALDHLVLTVRDIDHTCRFYQTVLGMEVVTFAPVPLGRSGRFTCAIRTAI